MNEELLPIDPFDTRPTVNVLLCDSMDGETQIEAAYRCTAPADRVHNCGAEIELDEVWKRESRKMKDGTYKIVHVKIEAAGFLLDMLLDLARADYEQGDV